MPIVFMPDILQQEWYKFPKKMAESLPDVRKLNRINMLSFVITPESSAYLLASGKGLMVQDTCIRLYENDDGLIPHGENIEE
ncbi:MAG: hypothetical protein BM485_14335 [Desulfobulbaceae bacterium DB1]|nr:MAG: hypothetical protein BM485_14335 [Desulfobulbaceae bacterium DB1]